MLGLEALATQQVGRREASSYTLLRTQLRGHRLGLLTGRRAQGRHIEKVRNEGSS